MALMERLAGYTLVGFHVKGYPVTDELLAPFAEHKKHGQLRCGRRRPSPTPVSPVFLLCPSCAICCWTATPPSTAAACPPCKAASWTFSPLNRTGLDDAGLLQAASIPKLSHIQIDHTAVTYEGLLAIAGTTASSRWPMCSSPRSRWNTSPKSSGKGKKARPAGRAGGGGMPQGVVCLLC